MFTILEVLKIVGGKLIKGKSTGRVRGVATDTRNLRRGELFIAIKGDKFDGHHFVAGAVETGAKAVLVSSAEVCCDGVVAVILVPDTVIALGLLARAHRLKFRIPVIAVTGSAGKTSFKEFMAKVLGKKFKALTNRGTENNHIGVPMTLLRLTSAHKAAVIEAGTNHFGEIDWLGSLICPSLVVYTNIGASHLAGLGSPEGVLKEKAALMKYVRPGGIVVLNTDDPYLRKLLKKKVSAKIITYGIEREADVRAVSVECAGSGFDVVVAGKGVFRLSAPVWGNVYNALAAVACGGFLKVSFKDTAAAMARVTLPKGRQCFHNVNGTIVIDDTYNANVVSYKNAIRTLSLIQKRGRRFLVAADMLELGESSASLHEDIGVIAGHAGIDHVLTIGRWAGFIGKGAVKTFPGVLAKHYLELDDLLAGLQKDVQKGDVVLVKGSRGMRMERVVAALLSRGTCC